jgi:hypothetical protein
MSRIKKWSTGPIGNLFPDHSNNGNPNTQGLSEDKIPGIEGYIEEDVVVASTDNRPLKNLAINDATLEDNSAIIGSEVDNGVFLDKLEGFNLTVLDMGTFENPDPNSLGESINITPIRIEAGVSIVNGYVSKVGEQIISHFLRDDGSILFPDYVKNEGKVVITLMDDIYEGKYYPVYDSVTGTFPSNFTDYEITIINNYTDGTNRKLYFKRYRNWEDIVPIPPQSAATTNTVDFQYDQNFGKDSEGFWASGSGKTNIKISDVEVSKKIVTVDKKIDTSAFIANNGSWKQNLITSGLFFEDINWKTETNVKRPLQDVAIDSDNTIFFVYKTEAANERLYAIPPGSNQAENYSLGNTQAQFLRKVKIFGNYVFISGDNGFIKSFNKTTFEVKDLSTVAGVSGNVRDVSYWIGKYWVLTDTKLHSSSNLTTWTSITLNAAIVSKAIDLTVLTGNSIAPSALVSSSKNKFKNPSFELGIASGSPTNWTVTIGGTGSTSLNTANVWIGSKSLSSSRSVGSNLIEQVLYGTFAAGSKITFSTFMKSSGASVAKLYAAENNGSTLVGTDFNVSSAWDRSVLTHTFTQDCTSIRFGIEHKSGTTALFIDSVQAEDGQAVSNYNECFEYLVVGIEKKPTDVENAPFLVVDYYAPTAIQYIKKYGLINKMFGFVEARPNQFTSTDSRNIYTITIQNDALSYDRINISSIGKNVTALNRSHNIHEYNTLHLFDGAVLLGASIYNKTLRIAFKDLVEHEIEFLSPTSPVVRAILNPNVSYENLANVIGTPVSYPYFGTSPQFIELPFIDNLLEAETTAGIGTYKPNTVYTIAFRVDGSQVYAFTLRSPSSGSDPWTYDDIESSLRANNTFTKFDLISKPFSQKSDGLYSMTPDGVLSPIDSIMRNSIYKIVSNPNNTDHYSKFAVVMTDYDLIKVKYDPNIKKTNVGYIEKPVSLGTVNSTFDLPTNATSGDVYLVKNFGYFKFDGTSWVDKPYFNKWDIVGNPVLKEVSYSSNNELTFTDNGLAKSWVPLPVEAGKTFVPGRILIKPDSGSEVGFSEDIDYVIDYKNNTVIRNTSENKLIDGKFPAASASWKTWIKDSTQNSSIVIGQTVDKYQYFDNTIHNRSQYGYSLINSSIQNEGAVYQYVAVPDIAVGNEYTFGVDLMSHHAKDVTVTITEVTAATLNTFGAGMTSTSVSSVISHSNWNRHAVTHVVKNADTTFLRVSIHSLQSIVLADPKNIVGKLYMDNAMFEYGSVASPYVSQSNESRIDPNMHVWIDFAQTREMAYGSEFSYDSSSYAVEFLNQPSSSKSYYLTYTYKRIFNPYKFGNNVPKFDVNYDARDDYFLYENQGHIWAINSVFALLSVDRVNPIQIDFKYHFPRIDKIKIRNKPDQYGNMIYIVKGIEDKINPYAPYDSGVTTTQYALNVSRSEILNTDDNETIYEINTMDYDFNNNDIYDRRLTVNSREHKMFNMSLYDQTLAYFPFTKDFTSTNGLSPLNQLIASKIVSIIKNFKTSQIEEVGAWGISYQITLRNLLQYPATSQSLFVNVLSGVDTNAGDNKFQPLKTIQAAIDKIQAGAGVSNIVVTGTDLITEDLSIDHTSKISIFASTYAQWSGNIQNKSPVDLQGFIFLNHNFYPISDVGIYYCTLTNSVFNCYLPGTIKVYNSVIDGAKNPVIHVKNELFPSPFIHPYMKNVNADDGIASSLPTVATSDSESIYPDVKNFLTVGNNAPVGNYLFKRCLVKHVQDSLVNYDIADTEVWNSTFVFNRCTMVDNSLLFETSKIGQSVLFSESILVGNGETRTTVKKPFDSRSNVNFDNCFADFKLTNNSADINYNVDGLMIGMDSNIDGTIQDAGFINTTLTSENYHLKSIALGFLSDSVCVNAAADGKDIGCYDEIRERIDIEVPKKLKASFAYFSESAHYPIVMNSEKITFALEMKPNVSFNRAGVIFDSRSSANDSDWLALVYNNNSGEYLSKIEQDPLANILDPYSFKIIVANKETRYVIQSPIQITSDDLFQSWHKLTFTINYEKVFNQKSTFDEHDRYQNIISFIHNDELIVESFLQYDMNYDKYGKLITGYNSDKTNDWNYNNISKFISIAGDYSGNYVVAGYYSELRIDNKFIGRKELALWNKKVVPFNDPSSYLNSDNFVQTFDMNNVNDLWTLRSEFDIGAKGHRFEAQTHRELDYYLGERVWALNGTRNNGIVNSDLSQPVFASITTDVPPSNNTEDHFPINLSKTLNIKVTYNVAKASFDSTTGVTIKFFTDPAHPEQGLNFYTHKELEDHINAQMALAANSATKIKFRRTIDNKFVFYTNDPAINSISLAFANTGDSDDFGFIPVSVHTWTSSLTAGVTTIKQNFTTPPVTIIGMTDAFAGLHNAWMEYAPNFTFFGPSSLGFSRKETTANKNTYLDILFSAKNGLVLGSPQTFSTYIYVEKSAVTNADIEMLVVDGGITTAYKFDSIENVYGFWWKLCKTVTPTTTTPKFGVRVLSANIVGYINAVQLESGKYATSFIPNNSSRNGLIEINKNLLSTERGVIFFRFKPLFDFQETNKTIMEMLAQTTDANGNIVSDTSHGFKIGYSYDATRSEGIVSFRTNKIEGDNEDSDNMAWDLNITETFWNKWHSVVILYDYTSSRFIYMFDYFKQSIDVGSRTHNFLTNLFIGRDAPVSYINSVPQYRDTGSAGIYVKDILVTNFTVSEYQLRQWTTSKEFFKESLLQNAINSVETRVNTNIANLQKLSANSLDIIDNIQHVTTRVTALEAASNSGIDINALKTRQDLLIISDKQHGIQIENLIISDTQKQADIVLHDSRLDVAESDIAAQATAVSQEIVNRVAADTSFANRLAAQTSINGANMIGIYDAGDKFAGTTVNAALLELVGKDESMQSSIDGILIKDASYEATFALMQHGDGLTYQWSASKASSNGWNISAIRSDLDVARSALTILQSGLTQEILDRTNADTSLTNDISLGNANIAANTLDISNLTGRVTTAEGQIVTLTTASVSTATSISGMSANITTIGSDVSNLKTRVSSLEFEHAAINTSVGIINGSITSINTSLATIIGDISGLDTRVTTAEADIVTVKSDATTLAGRVTDTELSIAGIGGQISTLSGLIANPSIPTTTGEPAAAGTVIGQIMFDPDTNLLWIYNGTLWVSK